MNTISIVCLALCAALVVGDINDARRAGLAKIESQVKRIQKLADDTSVEVGKREENIKIISKHEREFGEGIYDEMRFEVAKTAKSAYMLASLLESSNDVFRCIENREREALADIDKVYNGQFLNPGKDYELKAEDYQRKIIKTWKDDYYKAISQYGDIYKQAVNEVQKATSESSINSVVRQFDQVSDQMANIIVRVHPEMAKLHIQVLGLMDELVGKLQKYSRYIIDETTKNIKKCFPKSVLDGENLYFIA